MRNKTLMAITCLAGVLLASGQALAEKPAGAGGGKHGKPPKHEEQRNDERPSPDDQRRFDDESRRAIGDYYGDQRRAGKCPPGLAKKHNGCQPPGQAKAWARGRPLGREVIYYDLPPDLLRRLPPPPPRHRYVEVAGDVLMIAVGTGLVVDAIEDLARGF